MLTLDKVYHASYVLKEVIRPTDMINATNLSDDCQLYLKTENLQVTGAFKARGAYYKISQLSEEDRAKGVIACSYIEQADISAKENPVLASSFSVTGFLDPFFAERC